MAVTIGREFGNPNNTYQVETSISTHLIIKVIRFRNGTPDIGFLEIFGRRIIGELCFAALSVAALIEAFIRGVLSIIPSIVKCIDADCIEECFSRRVHVFFENVRFGVFASAETALNSIVALIKNVYESKMYYDTLVPCFVELNDRYLFKP